MHEVQMDILTVDVVPTETPGLSEVRLVTSNGRVFISETLPHKAALKLVEEMYEQGEETKKD